MKDQKLIIEQVVQMPDKLEEGTLYVSKEYALAIHLCPCGCGQESVTPINIQYDPSPTVWLYKENGEDITLQPSILNKACPNQSHYFITDSVVKCCQNNTIMPAKSLPPQIHYVKTNSEFYQLCVKGVKTFELRKNDRDYKAGDIFVSQEYNPETQKFTGRNTRSKIDYVLEGFAGLEPGYCIIQLGEVIFDK